MSQPSNDLIVAPPSLDPQPFSGLRLNRGTPMASLDHFLETTTGHRAKFMAGATEGVLPAAKILYFWLIMTAAENDCLAWPGSQVVMELIGVSRTHLGRAMSNLRQMGLIKSKFEILPRQGDLIYFTDPGLKELEAIKAPVLKKIKGANKKLSDDVIVKICQNVDSMVSYIRFGAEAIIDPEAPKVSTPLDWFAAPGWNGKVPRPEMWTALHFAGWYWALVSWHRSTHHLPIELPNWGLLARQISECQSPKQSIHQYIRDLFTYFDLTQLILQRSRNPIFILLNESSFSNRLVREKIQILSQMSQSDRDQLHHRLTTTDSQFDMDPVNVIG